VPPLPLAWAARGIEPFVLRGEELAK
jgi:hypothetical protein